MGMVASWAQGWVEASSKKIKSRAEAVNLKLVNNITSCAGEGGHNSEDIIISHKW